MAATRQPSARALVSTRLLAAASAGGCSGLLWHMHVHFDFGPVVLLAAVLSVICWVVLAGSKGLGAACAWWVLGMVALGNYAALVSWHADGEVDDPILGAVISSVVSGMLSVPTLLVVQAGFSRWRDTSWESFDLLLQALGIRIPLATAGAYLLDTILLPGQGGQVELTAGPGQTDHVIPWSWALGAACLLGCCAYVLGFVRRRQRTRWLARVLRGEVENWVVLRENRDSPEVAGVRPLLSGQLVFDATIARRGTGGRTQPGKSGELQPIARVALRDRLDAFASGSPDPPVSGPETGSQHDTQDAAGGRR